MVLVVGASGDLAAKKTYPSLFELWKSQLLPQSTSIYGFARTRHTHEQLRAHIRPYLLKHTAARSDGNNKTKPAVKDQNDVDAFLKLCFYTNGKSYGDDKVLLEILKSSSDLYNLLVYLAIPPHVFGESTHALKVALQYLDAKVPGFTRVILEKPFGKDTESCQELLDALSSQKWQESALYRIDHYLGKEIVQNIVTLRQHNQWLDALWNKNVVEAVHIVFKEPFGTGTFA
jgi:glucose-6-phosphate 1-dehydrogenase